jgi:uracil-DNA glycosylase family 4
MTVPDQIAQNPKIMIVGECPGADEERLGRPFVGRAGHQLDKILLVAGVIREECYITNVINERPPKNDFSIYYVNSKRTLPSETLTRARQELIAKIRRVNPKVVIALGTEATKAIVNKFGIECQRGSIFPIPDVGIPCIPTFHPSAILRGGGTSHWYLPAAIHDVQRAKAVANGTATAHLPNYKVITVPAHLDQWFGTVSQASALCAFDIETEYIGGEWIKCIGFAAGEEEGIVVPFGKELITGQLELLQVIRKWMTSGLIAWIGQNAYNFDMPMIKQIWGFEVKNYKYDTMVMHHVLYPEFPHDLATIASFYTLIPYWKDTSGENLYKYNAYDAVATWVSQQAMWKEIKDRKFDTLYTEYYQPLLRALNIITMRGMRIDKEYQLKLRKELKDEIKTLQTELDKIYLQHTNTNRLQRTLLRIAKLMQGGRKTVSLRNKKTQKFQKKRLSSLQTATEKEIKKRGTLNVRSTKDLAQFLYKTLKLPIKTKQGKTTTDVTALNQLYIKSKHPFLKTMLKIRNLRNMLSRWGHLKTDEDGLISTTYSFADTGRLKSGKFEAK